jgi:hypothetical protein
MMASIHWQLVNVVGEHNPVVGLITNPDACTGSRKACGLNSSRLGLSAAAGPESLYRREIGPVETADTEE